MLTPPFDLFIRALEFAAHKHCDQKRRDAGQTPYINHPIQVANILWQIGQVQDENVLSAALLHDTLEDTDTQPEELEKAFSQDILTLVQEVSDDKSLPKAERKRLQIVHAATISSQAKLIKLADKIANIQDIGQAPPTGWSLERRLEYLDWSEKVIQALRGVNPALEAHFDKSLSAVREQLQDNKAEDKSSDQ
ncbi:HD domain-containing protein [Candidatus Albibeggiatoa sp. nov. NOAA]|uniref:HD domain-containing protein n=1 Tax=Candidatus Albibeggiatoa sp. nov. NOAA TaxID=3162724 RepID=UPI0033013D6F|nr:HD domain-containing protein [Thiotrichaceae bacterium]